MKNYFLNSFNLTPIFRFACNDEDLEWKYDFNISDLKPVEWCTLIGIKPDLVDKSDYFKLMYRFTDKWEYKLVFLQNGVQREWPYIYFHSSFTKVRIIRNKFYLEPGVISFMVEQNDIPEVINLTRTKGREKIFLINTDYYPTICSKSLLSFNFASFEQTRIL